MTSEPEARSIVLLCLKWLGLFALAAPIAYYIEANSDVVFSVLGFVMYLAMIAAAVVSVPLVLFGFLVLAVDLVKDPAALKRAIATVTAIAANAAFLYVATFWLIMPFEGMAIMLASIPIVYAYSQHYEQDEGDADDTFCGRWMKNSSDDPSLFGFVGLAAIISACARVFTGDSTYFLRLAALAASFALIVCMLNMVIAKLND